MSANWEGAEPGDRPRLLIAEDNVVNQKVSVAMLDKIGYDTDVVSNGLKAVDAVSRHQYAATLMDCHMPEMDGYEATAAIRRLERERGSDRLPIIAMTAAAMEGEKDKCLAAGMDDYIAKPVKLDELAAVLKRWINGAAVRSPRDRNDAELDQVADSAHLDLARVAELRELVDKQDRDAFTLLAKIFFEDGRRRLTVLRAAFDSGDPAQTASEAHGLRGSAANLGAVRLSKLCEELEELGRSGTLAGTGDLMARIEEEYELVHEAAHRELQLQR
jgi:two-component system, sensor histidine kinase and response regulator